MIRLSPLAVALLLLAACDGTSSSVDDSAQSTTAAVVETPGAGALSAAEVQIYLANSTLTQMGDDEVWSIYFGRDTTMRGVTAGEGRTTERAQGYWAVTPEGQLCLEWGTAWAGHSGCTPVYKFRENYALVPPGGDIDEEDFRYLRAPGDLTVGGG